MSDLRCGDWRDVLPDVECDALISDPPYSERTHSGHNKVLDSQREVINHGIDFSSWDADNIKEFVGSWAPRTRGWMVVMTSHDLFPAYESALQALGRYVFQPIPCVIRGMSLRVCGDGPSSWAVYAVVSRPRNREFSAWGTLPGAYVCTRGNASQREQITGGKPVGLMSAIVRDYSRPGDLICDPCAGMATTGIAAQSLGRRFVGSEIDPATHARAVERLALPSQSEMFA